MTPRYLHKTDSGVLGTRRKPVMRLGLCARLVLLIGVLLWVSCTITIRAAHAQWNFAEEFNGGFHQSWRSDPALLPDESILPFRQETVIHQGAPTGASFVTVGTSSALQMRTDNPPHWSRYGYVSEAVLEGRYGQVEARVNTLGQGGTYIDGLFELWLVSSSDPTRYVHVGFFGDQFDSRRSWFYRVSGEGFSTEPGDPRLLPAFPYEANTWYRVRISQSPGGNLSVSIWDDAGTTRLVSHTFDLALESLGSSFRIGFSQWMGGPIRPAGLLSAVDYIRAQGPAAWRATALSTGPDNRTRLLWRHTNGTMSFWGLTPDGQHEGYQSYGPFPGWTAALLATGADNRSRLLWSHPGGVASLWSLSPLGLFENFVEHGPYPDWSPVALSAGADNLTRLLWEHMTGAVSLHLLSPTGVFQRYEQHGPFPGWKATAMGTGGDNRTRLLWTHGESGTVSLHTLSPNGVFQMHSAYGPYPGWTAALLDVGKSDNRTRLVWRHTSSGAISFWTLSPNGVFEMHSAYGPFPGWTATAISVGADNRTRLVWTHDTGAISLWLLSPNGEFERHVQYGPF